MKVDRDSPGTGFRVLSSPIKHFIIALYGGSGGMLNNFTNELKRK